MGIEQLDYPVFYRGFQVEKQDPFYDRDYNLCILCGRCVRVCHEVRNADIISFNQRGRKTVIGPAFERSHMDAGCEFCGACVEYCPTGALADKASKWEGKPQHRVKSTCALCGIGCQTTLLKKTGRVIGTLPSKDSLVNRGQLCVKGRFCVNELVNNHKRLRIPSITENGITREKSWDEALDLAAQKLSACKPEEFGLLVSANCTNEDLYIAQKFARIAMQSNQVDTPARQYYGAGFNAYLKLLKRSVPLEELDQASTVLCLGLDARFGRSVARVLLSRADEKGTRIISIHQRNNTITPLAEKALQVLPGNGLKLLQNLAEATRVKSLQKARRLKKEIQEIAGMLKSGSSIIMLGSEFLQGSSGAACLEAVEQIAENTKAGVAPLPGNNNLMGSIITGVYPELLPGGQTVKALKELWKEKITRPSLSWDVNSKKKLKVLYVIGERIPGNLKADFVIWQNIYAPVNGTQPELVLPAAAFTEQEGSFINGEGRLQQVHKAVEPPEAATADWQILCRLAGKMGKAGFEFASAEEVNREMAGLIPEFADVSSRSLVKVRAKGAFQLPAAGKGAAVKPDKAFPLVLSAAAVEHAYKGFPLDQFVGGAGEVFPTGVLVMNPRDATRSKLKKGSTVSVTSRKFQRDMTVTISKDQPQGFMQVTLPVEELPKQNPCTVKLRKKHV
jgi:formate dehydrogenase major subunit